MKRFLAWLLVTGPALAGDNLLRNASFEEWKDGAPAEWTVENGATKGKGPGSKVEKGAEGGLSLSGDAKTENWEAIAQEVAVKPGGFYRLRFEARGTGIKQEFGQFVSQYVGLFAGAGRTAVTRIEDIGNGPWAGREVLFAKPGVATLTVRAMLGKTGTLECRNLVFEELGPADSGSALLGQLARHYSHFEDKKLDWPALLKDHRAGLEGAGGPEAFVEEARKLLAEFHDTHTWIVKPDGTKVYPFAADRPSNFDQARVREKLAGAEQVLPTALAGTAPGGFAYLALASLELDDASVLKILKAIDARIDAPGFILDLRPNSGGNENTGRQIASVFCDQPRVYAMSKVRSGPLPGDFSAAFDRKVAPRKGKIFAGPVVVLTGPKCISSGECLAMMMRVFPNVTLVGLPTAGENGNPAPVELPNGVTVWFSRWVNLLPDGTATEGKGLQPSVEVKQAGTGDAALEKAVEILTAKTKK